jgi:hypothetical protein
MSRRLLQLSEIGFLLIATGCSTSAGALTPPDLGGDSTGGTTSSDSSTGGVPSVTGGAGSLGGGLATGGTVQTSPATGGATGVVVPTGGSTGTSSGTQVVMALPGTFATDISGTLSITLPAGATPVPVSSLKLTLCGAGAGGIVTPASLKIDYASVNCPQGTTVGNCQGGSNNTITSSIAITATGTGANCCYNLDFSTITYPLAPGQGAELKIQFREASDLGTVLKHDTAQTWSVYVDGQLATAKCVIAASATTASCS